MDEHAFVAGLERAVGTEFVVTHPHAKRTYESDGLLQYAVTPRAVVLAGSTEEVQRVVKLCHDNEVPWVARGAGSGLSGGAVPHEGGGLVVVSRQGRIPRVGLHNPRVVGAPGGTNPAGAPA